MFSWFGPQIAMQAMLSISQTYENTADYKIQTHSEPHARPAASTVATRTAGLPAGHRSAG